jgi:hypothetical protein
MFVVVQGFDPAIILLEKSRLLVNGKIEFRKNHWYIERFLYNDVPVFQEWASCGGNVTAALGLTSGGCNSMLLMFY